MGRGYSFDVIPLVGAGQASKLHVWEIRRKSTGAETLGVVSWDPSSRAYRFTVLPLIKSFSAQILLDLGNFCKLHTEIELNRKLRAAG